MSKLIFIYLLSLIILNTQSTPCTQIEPQQETEAKVKNPKRQLSTLNSTKYQTVFLFFKLFFSKNLNLNCPFLYK